MRRKRTALTAHRIRARRASIAAHDPDRNDDSLRILADELAAVVEQTEAKVDAALAGLQAMREFFAKVDPGRSRALG